ncbi:hypothetical protein [Xenorhabdus bharatensis]|uniref:hypothetical protein n=1 Tax=Xenorhabdus bharatensis TaxID=3136256 RepID=UPI0030F4AD4D
MTLNNVTYQIQVTVPDSMSDGVRHIVAINTYIVQFLQNMDKWMTQNGSVEVTLPNGQTVSLQSIKAMNEAIVGKLDKSQNGADIPSKTEFVKNIGLSDTLRKGSFGFGGEAVSVPQDTGYNGITQTSVVRGSGVPGTPPDSLAWGATVWNVKQKAAEVKTDIDQAGLME